MTCWMCEKVISFECCICFYSVILDIKNNAEVWIIRATNVIRISVPLKMRHSMVFCVVLYNNITGLDPIILLVEVSKPIHDTIMLVMFL